MNAVLGLSPGELAIVVGALTSRLYDPELPPETRATIGVILDRCEAILAAGARPV